MPYTFAHPGFIFPFKKWKASLFSTTGLVFGSIAPDYDILFRLTNVRFHIFQYDLKSIIFLIYPIAFISAILFHIICRNVLIAHLPDSFRDEYQKYTAIDFIQIARKNFAKISFSIFFAILLHLLLDLLCHSMNAYYMKLFFFALTGNEFIAHGAYLAAIYVLPLLFTLAGFYLAAKYVSDGKVSMNNFRMTGIQPFFWLLLTGIAVILTFFKLLITQPDRDFMIDYITIAATSSLLASMYITCFIYFLAEKLKMKIPYNGRNR